MQTNIPVNYVESNFISANELAQELGITSRRLRQLAAQGRVVGAFKHDLKGWLFPKWFHTVRPGKRGPASSWFKIAIPRIRPQAA